MSKKSKIILSIIGVVASVAFLVITAILAEEAMISASLAVVLTVIAIILIFIAISFAAKVDYETGVYECRNCGYTFKPTFKAYFFGMHTITTRRLKCLECGKSTWCKRRSVEKGE
ncbi:MAG: hypothetical protein IJO09_08525 [Oscillospiraceae bacterium]|nr:hypothetical protein [Oscillospiraceae bacterium]